MSAADGRMVLDADDLNPTDRAILDELSSGRVTPAYVAENHGYTSGNVRNRITSLAKHGHVEGLGGGIYRLVDDPREDGPTRGTVIHDAGTGDPVKVVDDGASIDVDQLARTLDRALEDLPENVPGRTAVADARAMLPEGE